jgi:hypothetical protein
MDVADAEDQAVLAKLDRLNAFIFARDPAVVDELWSDLGFRLVGSEAGEIDETREELAAHMHALFAKPIRISWAWGSRKVTRHGDLAWVFAESEIVIASADRTERKPYRMFCIFQKVEDRWYWRAFNGSEPIGPWSETT